MTPETANRRAHPLAHVRRAMAGSARTSRARHKAFKQAVPSAVQARLDESLRQDGRSPERLAELYELYALDREFGVTRVQFQRYARGVTNQTSAPAAPTQVANDGHDVHASSRSTDCNGTDTRNRRPARRSRRAGTTSLGRKAFHERMKAIGEIVDSTFGALATHQPDLWGHGAYLMLVGSVVACLAERHTELSTSELATLSKILTEQRSLTLKQAEADRKLADQQSKATAEHSSLDAAGNGDAQPRKLPAHFGDVVRQIYGTSFQDDFTVASEGSTSSPEGSPGATGGLPTSAGAESSVRSTT